MHDATDDAHYTLLREYVQVSFNKPSYGLPKRSIFKNETLAND